MKRPHDTKECDRATCMWSGQVAVIKPKLALSRHTIYADL